MPSNLRVKQFISVLKQEILNEMSAYEDKFKPIFDENQEFWPTSYQKRYITLSGALRDSLQVNVTESSINFTWNTPYASRIRYGWVTKNGVAKRGRDWAALALKKHPIKDAVRRAAIKSAGRVPGLRLV